VLGYVWRVEYPRGLDEEELKMLKQEIGRIKGNEPEFVAQGDVVAGIRIIVDGTVIDATLEGLLNQKSTIEATMIARIKRETGSDE
jgi:F0F1-type ATP synthase delta subunit